MTQFFTGHSVKVLNEVYRWSKLMISKKINRGVRVKEILEMSEEKET